MNQRYQEEARGQPGRDDQDRNDRQRYQQSVAGNQPRQYQKERGGEAWDRQRYGQGEYGAYPQDQGDRFRRDEYQMGGGGYDRDRNGRQEDWRRGDYDNRHGRSNSDRGQWGRQGSSRFDQDRDRGMQGGYQQRGGYERGGDYGQGGQSWPNAGGLYAGEQGRSRGDGNGWRGGERSGGGHRGRGPRDYERSDDRLREDVCERLMQDDDVDASDVKVEVSGSEVTLSGTVDSKFAKRCAEDCADSVSGVGHVQNNLRTKGSSDDDSSSRSSKSASSSGNAGKAAQT